MGVGLWVVVEVLALASLYVRLYSLVFLASNVIQRGIYNKNFY